MLFLYITSNFSSENGTGTYLESPPWHMIYIESPAEFLIIMVNKLE